VCAVRLSQNEDQSLLLQVEDLDFRYVARFRNQIASNAIAVENLSRNFAIFDPWKFRGWVRKMSEWICQVQPRTKPFIYFFRVAAARDWPGFV